MAELNTLGAVIKQTYENEANTNAFTDAEKSKLDGVSSVAMSGSFNDLTDVPDFVELDDSGTIPMEYLNVSSLAFKGAWDAASNTPSLIDGTGSVGDFYKVSTAGTHNFGNGDYIFSVGDWVMFAGGVWQRIGVHESVVSINGKTGTIVLTAADVGAVATVNGKSGTVVLTAADVAAKPDTYVPAYADITGKPDLPNLYQKKMRGNIGPAIPAALYRKSSNQAITNGAAASKLTWQVSVYDQFGILNNGTDFTVPAWAKYARVTGNTQWGGLSGSTNGPITCGARVNGTDAPGASSHRIFGNINVMTNSYSTGVIPVNSGDILSIYVTQSTGTSGSTRNVESGSTGNGTWVQIELFE